MLAVLCVLLGVVAQAGIAAHPVPSKARAQSLLSDGTALYEKGNFAAALEKFRAAFAVYPSPKLNFNIGQALRDLGRPLEARDAFNVFVIEAADAAPGMVAEARKALTDVESKLGRAQITCSLDGTEISIDGRVVGRVPILVPVWITPGEHRVLARHPIAQDLTKDFFVGAGQLVSIPIAMLSRTSMPASERPVPNLAAADSARQSSLPARRRVAHRSEVAGGAEVPMSLQGQPSTQPVHESARTPLPRWLPWAGATASVALTLATIVTGILADDRYGHLRSTCGQTAVGCTADQIDSVRSRDATASVLAVLAGATAVATGVTIFVNTREGGISSLWRF